MDNNIYIVRFHWWFSDENEKRNILRKDTSFPKFGVITYQKPNHDAWSLLVQNNQWDEKGGESISYVRFIVWDRVKRYLNIGTAIEIFEGEKLLATGLVMGTIDEPSVFDKLVEWSPSIPKKSQ